MTDSLDAPFYDLISDLDEARLETLQVLKENGGQIIGTSKIEKKRGVSRQAVHQLLDKMRVESENHEGEGLVTVEEFESGNRITFTSIGRKVAENTPYGEGSLDKSLDTGMVRLNQNRLHGITIDVGVKNSDRVPNRWWGKLQSYEDVDVLEDQENDYIVARDKWVFRCHKESVTMQLRQGCTFDNDNSAESFSEFNQSLQKAVQWLSNAVGVPFRVEHCDVKRAECAFEEDHQALLADAVPGLDLQDIWVHDRDIGQDVIEFDKSKVVPEREALSGVRSEEVARNLERENRQLALNNEAVRFRHGFESEASIQELNPVSAVRNIKQVGENQEKLEQVVEKAEKVKQRQQQFLELKAEERRKTEVMEQVVEKQQRQLENQQEIIERLVQRVEQVDKREKNSTGFDDPVQKVFMDTWSDEDYGRPFFQDASDKYDADFHIRAANKRDGGVDTVLHAETVARLRS